MLTLARLVQWCCQNNIDQDAELIIASFPETGMASIDVIEAIKLNSGGVGVQLEIYPNGWNDRSEGTTRLSEEDDE